MTRFNPREAAAYLKLGLSTLNKLRVSGGGPVYSKLGGRVVYDQEELDKWVAGRRRTSTADHHSRRA